MIVSSINMAPCLLNKLSTTTLNQNQTMKKNLKKAPRNSPSLGDLILAVSSVSRNNREAVAAVADLLDTGRVTINSHGRKVRARVY